jgi:hypothetical protein|tara:strand:+ start:217 stop:492 length:276 start_codon:yes stop_codon:yes gene_type:complete
MMQCNKTGISDKEWKTILDVLNVYDPNDICHVYPEMGSPEFVQDVTSAFHKVRQWVLKINEREGITHELTESELTLTQEELDAVRESSFGK